MSYENAEPFVNWVGGKRSALEFIKKYIPTEFKTYYEPFVGGGAMFFDLKPKTAVLSDLNFDLINAYKVVQNNVEELITSLEVHEPNNNKSYFHMIKDKINNDENINKVERAAMFIYINKTCFKSLYRLTKKNKLSSTYGYRKNALILNKENLRACSLQLKKTSICHQNYDSIKPNSGDFVYLDPPYHNCIQEYTIEKFNESDQKQLKLFCDDLKNKNVDFALSNSDTEFIRDLYKDYKIIELDLYNTFYSKPFSKRPKRKEVLIIKDH